MRASTRTEGHSARHRCPLRAQATPLPLRSQPKSSETVKTWRFSSGKTQGLIGSADPGDCASRNGDFAATLLEFPEVLAPQLEVQTHPHFTATPSTTETSEKVLGDRADRSLTQDERTLGRWGSGLSEDLPCPSHAPMRAGSAGRR